MQSERVITADPIPSLTHQWPFDTPRCGWPFNSLKQWWEWHAFFVGELWQEAVAYAEANHVDCAVRNVSCE